MRSISWYGKNIKVSKKKFPEPHSLFHIPTGSAHKSPHRLCGFANMADQVEAEAELRGWQGFRGWAWIRSHVETTDHSQKLVSALVCRCRRCHVTWYSAWLIPHIFLKLQLNHNQHALNIKHLANFIKKYWTCFRYQKWQIFWCASRLY